MWNTVTVQYNPLIEEEWDEHFKVTCEYGYDFWKTVTFPFLDVEYVLYLHTRRRDRDYYYYFRIVFILLYVIIVCRHRRHYGHCASGGDNIATTRTDGRTCVS